MKKLLLLVVSVMFVGTLVAQNDLATFGLKGNVTKLIQKGSDDNMNDSFECEWMTHNNFTFSKTGKLVGVGDSVVGFEPFEDYNQNVFYQEYFKIPDDYGYPTWYYITRDKQNRITSVTFEAPGGDGDIIDTFLYDEKGRVQEVMESFVYVGWGYEGEEGVGKKTNGYNIKYFYDENDNVTKAVKYDAYEKKTHTVTFAYKEFDAAGNWTKRVANCPTRMINNQVETRVLSY